MPERVEELERVHLEHGVQRFRVHRRLQIRNDLRRQNLHQRDGGVGLRGAQLRRGRLRRDRDQQVERRVLVAPVLRRVRGVFLVESL